MIDVEKILEELTLEEKACLLSGHRSWYTNRVSRLDLPSIILTDGPHGLRLRKAEDKSAGLGETELSTCFPAACTTASSWNKELLYKMGRAMGEECRHYGVNLILGPAVNIKRNPLCGRNFEYFSEDPLIAGTMGTALTRGIEDMGVGTSVKHFACNNKEASRYFGDSLVDERALREIYLKAFEPIIKEGKPQTVMCSYNKVNGKYASENPFLLNEVLREEWGFNGLVMSDWGAVNDRVEGLKCGLDLEMPGDIAYNRRVIVDAVKDGSLSVEALDTAVRRVLNMINNTTVNNSKLPEGFDAHADLALEIALDSAVLMKNQGRTLPLDKSSKYLVVGEMFENMRYQGAGSSLIRPYKLTTPKAAFDAHGVDYDYAPGYSVNSFENDCKLVNSAIEKAKNADTVIFFGGLSEYAESEGIDRATLSLPQNQLYLLDELVKLNKKIIFVMFGGSPVDTSFDKDISALLNMYLPGEEGGEAAYRLLFGLANPSGRLAESWPISYSDVPFGSEFTDGILDRYKESIFVGYRYFTSFGVPVKYPFGFGLSYTTFDYSNMRAQLHADGVRISVDVENTGNMDGSTVLEIYAEAPVSGVVKPVRELRAFDKLHLAAGEKKTAQIDIPLERLKYYLDGAWRLENGEYTFCICLDSATVIVSAVVDIEAGENYEDNPVYRKLYASGREAFLGISDQDYDSLLGFETPPIKVTRPYDLNTPMKDYKTVGGRLVYKALMLGFKSSYNIEKRRKDSPDKETKVKNALFSWQLVSVMSLRSLCFGSEGRLSHKLACVLLDVANNHPLKAIARLCRKEKTVNLPD